MSNWYEKDADSIFLLNDNGKENVNIFSRKKGDWFEYAIVTKRNGSGEILSVVLLENGRADSPVLKKG